MLGFKGKQWRWRKGRMVLVMYQGYSVWEGRGGLASVKTAVVDALPLSHNTRSGDGTLQIILNTQNDFSVEELEVVRQRHIRPELAMPPSEEELESAVEKMKCGRADGKSGILIDMLKAVCYGEDFMTLLKELVEDVWRQGEVPAYWQDAVLVPIPKKGDSACNNWRGIYNSLQGFILFYIKCLLGDKILTGSENYMNIVATGI